jgi:hypothetical protein
MVKRALTASLLSAALAISVLLVAPIQAAATTGQGENGTSGSGSGGGAPTCPAGTVGVTDSSGQTFCESMSPLGPRGNCSQGAENVAIVIANNAITSGGGDPTYYRNYIRAIHSYCGN